MSIVYLDDMGVSDETGACSDEGLGARISSSGVGGRTTMSGVQGRGVELRLSLRIPAARSNIHLLL